jgi:hypothetical protein
MEPAWIFFAVIGIAILICVGLLGWGIHRLALWIKRQAVEIDPKDEEANELFDNGDHPKLHSVHSPHVAGQVRHK